MALRFASGRLIPRVALPVAVLAAAMLLVAMRADRSSGRGFAFMYSAKYACVNEVGSESSLFVKQGAGITYRTVVNVHNPNSFGVTIGKKAAGALTERDPGPGKISDIVPLDLIPDQVLAIDCRDVLALLGGVQPNGDGMVVVFSTASLDVWAAYTMRGSASSGVGLGLNGNVDVVAVPERRIG